MSSAAMGTPTAEVFEAMRLALERIRDCTRRSDCGGCEDCQDEARRALALLADRMPLRESVEIRDMLSNIFGHDRRDLPTRRIDNALDTIDTALFGTPTKREEPAT